MIYFDYEEYFYEKHFPDVYEDLILDECLHEEATELANEIVGDMYRQYQFDGGYDW